MGENKMKELSNPCPHPYKEEFKKFGISQMKLGYNMKLTHSYLNHILNGYIPMPTKMYQEFSELIQNLKQQNKKN